jgi:hypothetical protein
MLKTKEFLDLMAAFEKSRCAHGYRKDKEHKDEWRRKIYYQDGELNNLFIAYMEGYSLAKSMAIQGAFE